jgi:hypothetical protein
MTEEVRKEIIMKEIDFLPEWYKSGRRRQINYRTQYFVLGGIFMVLGVWNFVTSYSISNAKAQVVDMATQQRQAEKVSARLVDLKNELHLFQKRDELIKSIDSKINVADIFAEMSYLSTERIVLSKIELISERFAEEQNNYSSSNTGTVVRTAQTNVGSKLDLLIGDVRFKILIAGVAADASDVAALILKMEDSPYFCQVALSYSKNTDMEIKGDNSLYPKAEAASQLPNTGRHNKEPAGNIQVSKFEISCYLANYREQ